jgi:hypothetical protein
MFPSFMGPEIIFRSFIDLFSTSLIKASVIPKSGTDLSSGIRVAS